MSDAFALTAPRLFDGEAFHADAALVIRGGLIEAILPAGELSADIPLVAHGGTLLAPGFVDLQVNGGGGVMFNEAPTLETLRRMAEAHAAFGTVAMLPTLITDRNEKMLAALAAVSAAQGQGNSFGFMRPLGKVLPPLLQRWGGKSEPGISSRQREKPGGGQGGGSVQKNTPHPAPDVVRGTPPHRKRGEGTTPLAQDNLKRSPWGQGVPGIAGIHLEGPYLSPERPGIHDPALIRAPGDELAEIIALLPPVALVTLAPEAVPASAIAALKAAGVHLAIGHSEASFEQAMAGFDQGITGVTHLFNAMSQLNSRAPGVVGAALARQSAWCSIIADGHHVHGESLKLALRLKPAGSLVLVTDAMAECGVSEGGFRFRGLDITIRGGRCTAANGTLAGSALDMASAVRNAIRDLGVPLAEALRMASLYPARAVGLEARLGRLAVGRPASLVALDAELFARRTWIDGVVAG